MSIRSFFKKFGKRKAGVWGRVNHPRDMRAASKGVRQARRIEVMHEIDEIDHHDVTLDLITDEEPH